MHVRIKDFKIKKKKKNKCKSSFLKYDSTTGILKCHWDKLVMSLKWLSSPGKFLLCAPLMHLEERGKGREKQREGGREEGAISRQGSFIKKLSTNYNTWEPSCSNCFKVLLNLAAAKYHLYPLSSLYHSHL